ncbi:hypothetical protein ANPL_02165 [Anaplasma platys]|uniref:SAM-dependent methyltransferase n=1 Tax=Anaplasma platys TaxID=949 RepID=A0A858PY62_9RICK|nr:SAM-dependent methyltransferase [Anaplasma platys]QJC27514.1 hypothetical protein ANPL_02165 [Anaplasma platys]
MKGFIFSEGNAVPMDKFIGEALYNKSQGYYMTRAVFGRSGDFITAPEISQLFGEIVAVWLLQYLESVKISEKFALVELGPGRGTMMADIMRVMEKFPEYYKLIEVYLVEVSPLLRAAQHNVLAEHAKKGKVFWHDNISELPHCPTIIVANEFFDALPLKQFVLVNGGWRENYVWCGPEGLRVVQLETEHNLDFDSDLPDGSVIEKCSAAEDMLCDLENILVRNGGAGLIIDYGYVDPVYKSTIQAVKDHRFCSFLDYVGECDISACVDFNALLKALKSIKGEVITQREFLYKFGIRERLELLVKNATKEQEVLLRQSFLRLTENMGTLFKVLLLHHSE